ncbi:MAG TPA: hypothetical protein VJ400_00135 [Thermoplasmata archaeon]|nr:hypothetical protein [Thermoplasmata archaeon]
MTRSGSPRAVLFGRVLIAIGSLISVAVAILALLAQPLPLISGFFLLGGVVLVVSGAVAFQIGRGEAGEGPIMIP